MSFNFKKAIEFASKKSENDLLGAIILAPSGGGKSFLTGTLGVKTLYLHTLGEDHGPQGAKAMGGDLVVPLCINYSDEGKLLTLEDGRTPDNDAIYANLLSILSSGAALAKAGFKAIALDGAPEVEAVIRGTALFREKCRSNKGTHNTFQEGPAVNEMLRPILNLLKDVQREHGMHYLVTCTLDVQAMDESGNILGSSPQMSTYSVAETLVRQFGDILAVGRMTKGESIKHKIQFMCKVSRSSKTAVGTVKKSINFNPRLGGFKVEDLPAIMDADLAKVVELKKTK